MDSYMVLLDMDKSMIVSGCYVRIEDEMVKFLDMNKFVISAFTIANIKGYWKILPETKAPKMSNKIDSSKTGNIAQRI